MNFSENRRQHDGEPVICGSLVDLGHGFRDLALAFNAPVTSAAVATITSRGLATRGYIGYVYISLDDANVDTQCRYAEFGELGKSRGAHARSYARLITDLQGIANIDFEAKTRESPKAQPSTERAP